MNRRVISRNFLSCFCRFSSTESSTAPIKTPSDLSLTFASPSKVFFNKTTVKQVDVPTFSGNFGILANHVPTVAVLKAGVVEVTIGDKKERFFVTGGSVTINQDSTVQVLVEEAKIESTLSQISSKQTGTMDGREKIINQIEMECINSIKTNV